MYQKDMRNTVCIGRLFFARKPTDLSLLSAVRNVQLSYAQYERNRCIHFNGVIFQSVGVYTLQSFSVFPVLLIYVFPLIIDLWS